MERENEVSGQAVFQTPEIIVAKNPSRGLQYIMIFLTCLCLGLIVFAWSLTQSPRFENQQIIIDIPKGVSAKSIATLLHERGVIRSPETLIFLAKIKGVDTRFPSGVFQFVMPMSVFAVVDQLSANERGISQRKVTIPEGTSNKQIADMLMKNFPDITREEFLYLSQGKEGYLFPDTYFFFINATSGPVVASLSENFTTRTDALRRESLSQNKKWSDIIIMASLIEDEAGTDEDRKIISGILWNRIKQGMRLQVDASFVYLMNKASSEITFDDLAYDSPYNTYRYGGLPPAPITNPGLKSIEAALFPTETDYLFYLSDKSGVMHYATTFTEHKFNKAKYLR